MNLIVTLSMSKSQHNWLNSTLTMNHKQLSDTQNIKRVQLFLVQSFYWHDESHFAGCRGMSFTKLLKNFLVTFLEKQSNIYLILLTFIHALKNGLKMGKLCP